MVALQNSLQRLYCVVMGAVHHKKANSQNTTRILNMILIHT